MKASPLLSREAIRLLAALPGDWKRAEDVARGVGLGDSLALLSSAAWIELVGQGFALSRIWPAPIDAGSRFRMSRYAREEDAARERWTEVRITDRGAGRLDRIRQGALRGGRG